MKKIYIILFVLISSFSFSARNVYSATDKSLVVYEKNADEIRPIASLTKIMNILVALDEVKKGNISLDTMISIDKNTAMIKETTVDLRYNDKIALRDLLRAEVIYSANNAAYAVGYNLFNDLDLFVKKMNEKAIELGMKDTKFYTPAGLPTSYTNKPLDISTVKDLHKLAVEACKHLELLKWSSEPYFEIRNKRYYNRNKILGINGTIGLKTGYHSLAGYNMISVSDIAANRLITISLSDSSEEERINTHLSLQKEFKNSLLKLISKNQNYGQIRVKNSKEKFINAKIESDFYYPNKDIIIEEDVFNLKGKVLKGDTVGFINIYTKDKKLLAKIKLISTSSTRKLSFFEKLISLCYNY